MLRYNKLISTLTTLTKGETFLIHEFEKHFRSCISSLDIQTLLDGPIPQHITQNILSSSLQHLSEYAYKQFEDTNKPIYQQLAAQLWNPLIVELLLHVGLGSVEQERRPSTQTTKIRNGSMQKAFSKLEISNDDASRVRSELRKYTSKVKQPYQNRFHKHISCERKDCNFCLTMFKTVNITKCVGHKPCHKTGYYPHVGTSLWSMIKKRHTSNVCDFKIHPCKEGEILAISGEILDIPELTKPLQELDPTHWAYEGEDSNVSLSEKESVYYPTVKRRRGSASSSSTITSRC